MQGVQAAILCTLDKESYSYLEAPTTVEKVPGAHCVQAIEDVAPKVEEKVPAGHKMQPTWDVVPGFGAKLPAGQSTQLLVEFEYDPVGHSVQAREPGIVETNPGGHVWQDAADDAANVFENVPIAHWEQLVLDGLE